MTTVNLTAVISLSLNLIASLFLLSFLPSLLLLYWWDLWQVMTLWSDSLHMSHWWSKYFADAVTNFMFFCCSSWGAQTFSHCICFFFDHSQNTQMTEKLHRLSDAEVRWIMSTEERATAKIAAQVSVNRAWERKDFKIRSWAKMQIMTWSHEMLLTWY